MKHEHACPQLADISVLFKACCHAARSLARLQEGAADDNIRLSKQVQERWRVNGRVMLPP